MNKIDYTKQDVLLCMISRLDGKVRDANSFVIALIKRNVRVQELIKSKISSDELKKETKCTDSDIAFLMDKMFIRRANAEDMFILTIKGILKAVSIREGTDSSDSLIYENFLDDLFDDRFIMMKEMDKPLSAYEKVWLLTMISLNAFDETSAINTLRNQGDRQLYAELYNQMGAFILKEKFISDFQPIECDSEFLRRELETIDKKIDYAKFGKKRDKFFVSFDQKRKKEILNQLLRKIFISENHKTLKLEDVEKVRNLFRCCETYFYQISRGNLKNKPDGSVYQAINLFV